jgi:hypothetical protein
MRLGKEQLLHDELDRQRIVDDVAGIEYTIAETSRGP